MTFERTHDLELVRSIVTHPKVWAHVTEDGEEPDQYQPLDHPAIWYVLVKDGDELLGLWIFHPRGSLCWEVHTCLLPNAWGRGRQAAREMARWIFENTACRRIITAIPAYNRAALRFARAAGMTEFGTNERSWLKHGQIQDTIMLGLTKEN